MELLTCRGSWGLKCDWIHDPSDPRMTLNFCQADSAHFVEFEASLKQVSQLSRNTQAVILDAVSCYLVLEFCFVSALPGRLTSQQLVAHDPQRPDVILGGVDIVLHGFWRHVQRGSDIVRFLCVAALFLHESKICDFDYSIFEQYVGWFEIPVNIPLAVHPAVALQDLPKQGFKLLLTELSVRLQLASEVTFIAVLRDYVAIIKCRVGR